MSIFLNDLKDEAEATNGQPQLEQHPSFSTVHIILHRGAPKPV